MYHGYSYAKFKQQNSSPVFKYHTKRRGTGMVHFDIDIS